jgi:tRNA(fMet)-specific endonuclease VapC
MKFLIDTNICIFYLKGKYDLQIKFQKIGIENCFISEITVAELKYGAEYSEKSC